MFTNLQYKYIFEMPNQKLQKVINKKVIIKIQILKKSLYPTKNRLLYPNGRR